MIFFIMRSVLACTVCSFVLFGSEESEVFISSERVDIARSGGGKYIEITRVGKGQIDTNSNVIFVFKDDSRGGKSILVGKESRENGTILKASLGQITLSMPVVAPKGEGIFLVFIGGAINYNFVRELPSDLIDRLNQNDVEGAASIYSKLREPKATKGGGH